MTLKLYYSPGACSLAPHICLEEAGTEFEAVRVSLPDGEQRSAEYLALNPMGRIPALHTENGVLTENIAVLTYIASRFPAAGLLPFDDSWLLGRALEQMSWLATFGHVAIAQIWRTERFTNDESAMASIRQAGRETIEKCFVQIEGALDGDWLMGDRFTVLDPYLLVFWRWGLRLEKNMEAMPRWADHTARMMARPATRAALAREAAPADRSLLKQPAA